MKLAHLLIAAIVSPLTSGLASAAVMAQSPPQRVAQVTEDTQITEDQTLGAERSIINRTNLNGASTSIITGGALRGTNLFHSFDQFSVGAGDTAVFNYANTVENIISRVTGLEPSSLDGTLQAQGSANLFLINPAGIVIGPNASLDIGGSFVASTSEGLRFENGFVYDARTAKVPPLLTVSAPVGLLIGPDPGSLAITGSSISPGLSVTEGQTLALIGGEISISGAKLSAAGGHVEIASVSEFSNLTLTPTARGFDIGFDGANGFGNIQMTDQSVIDASGIGGGSIELQGQAVTIADGSALISDTLGEQDGSDIQIVGDRVSLLDSSYLGAATSGSGDSGSIFITAAQDIEITGTSTANYKRVELNSFLGTRQIAEREIGGILTTTTDSGRTGDISLTAQRLLLDQGVLVSTETFGTGNSGDISVIATDSVRLRGSGFLAGSRTTGIALLTPNGIPTGRSTAGIPAGGGGNIDVSTARLTVEDGSGIVAGTTSDVASGDVAIQATDSVLLRGDFAPFFFPTSITTVSIGGRGAAGDLTIKTGRLSVQDGSPIFADSGARAIVGQVDVGGPAGNVTIIASESVEIVGGQPLLNSFINSGIRSRTFTDAPAGSVQITTPTLTLQDGGQITSAARNAGSGGAININAQTVVVSGTGTGNPDALSGIVASSGVAAQTSFVDGQIISVPASGDGGTITINAETLTVQDTAEISVSSFGTGVAGNLNITADAVRLERDGNLTAATSSGDQGNITVIADRLTLDGGNIAASSGSNDGGNLSFNLQDVLLLRNGSLISTEAGTAAEGGGDGGSIAFEGGLILAVPDENSDIIANAFTGQGGRIVLNAQDILGFETSTGLTTAQLRNNQTNDISASSKLGAPGEVQILNQVGDPEQGLTELPTELLEGDRTIGQSVCATGPGSRFVVTGRGGVPLSPQAVLSEAVVWTDENMSWAEELARPTGNLPAGQAADVDDDREPAAPLVEAQGWSRLPDGGIALLAPDGAGDIASALPTCQAVREAANP